MEASVSNVQHVDVIKLPQSGRQRHEDKTYTFKADQIMKGRLLIGCRVTARICGYCCLAGASWLSGSIDDALCKLPRLWQRSTDVLCELP